MDIKKIVNILEIIFASFMIGSFVLFFAFALLKNREMCELFFNIFIISIGSWFSFLLFALIFILKFKPKDG